MESDQTRENEIQVKRHSFAHLLAMAVLSLYKEARIGIGAATDNGFYQEFLLEKELNNEDLQKISEEMLRLISLELPFQQITISKNEAFDILHLQGQLFKTEILEQIPDETVSFYKTGSEFFDLCKGPHVSHTGNLGPFMLTHITKVHWNNDESRPRLQRIYGVAFQTQEELDKYLTHQKDVREKNYLKTGNLIELFSFEELTHIPTMLPKGVALFNNIKDYITKANIESGFKLINTPLGQINPHTKNVELTSYNYDDLLKVFKSKKRSYKHLPFKLAQLNTFFYTEKIKNNTPLLDQFYSTGDIGITICDREDLKNQINLQVSKILNIIKYLGLTDFKLELALKGTSEEKYSGGPKEWLKLQGILVEAVKPLGITIYEAVNTAENVGPGFNFIYEDIQNTRWNLANIYIDIKNSQNDSIKFIDAKNKQKDPYIIVKSFSLSIERIFALIIEKYQGAFPLWLSPVHVNVIPISKKYNAFAKEIYFRLMQEGLSATIDLSVNTMQNKIKNSQQKLIPYMLILGQKEQLNKTVSVRPRSDQDLGMMKIDEFIGIIKQELRNYQTF